MNRAKIIAFLKTYKFLGKNFNRDLTFVKRKKNKKRKKKWFIELSKLLFEPFFDIFYRICDLQKNITENHGEKNNCKKKKEEKYFFSKFFFPIFFPKNFFTFIFVYKNYFSLKLKKIYIYPRIIITQIFYTITKTKILRVYKSFHTPCPK